MMRRDLRFSSKQFLAAGIFLFGMALFGSSYSLHRLDPDNPPGDSPARSGNTVSFPLRGTEPLSAPTSSNLREEQRQQIIRYFRQQINATPAKRDHLWQPDFSSFNHYEISVREHRKHLREMLGLIPVTLGTPQNKVLYESAGLRIEDLTLSIDKELSARALIFSPQPRQAKAAIIAIPPEDQTREEFAGIVQGTAPAPWLVSLLEREIEVIVPLMTERRDDHRICQQAGGKDRRRILWRAGFVVGRTLVGLEVQQVMALREYLENRQESLSHRIAVMGEGQGGMTALFAGAVDEHFAAVGCFDYFQQREGSSEEPVDRVLYGQLNEFGDAELAALIAPRPLLIIAKQGGTVPLSSVQAESTRARRFYKGLGADSKLVSLSFPENVCREGALRLARIIKATQEKQNVGNLPHFPSTQVEEASNQNFEAVFEYLRKLDLGSEQVRENYWQLASTPPQDRLPKTQKIRQELAGLVGEVAVDAVPLHARTSLLDENQQFLTYEVLLDLAPGLEVYGHLLVPRKVAGETGQRLPAVICQHGFDGSPKYISGVGDDLETADHFYHRYGARLASRGYVVFAPYLTVPEDHTPPIIVRRADLVNPLVRLAAPLGLMRTSMELAKLHRVVDFVQSLSFVDPERIGYYGLSYGGYSAIWMAPLEPRLKASVISAHFNDWQTMLTDTRRYGDSYWTLPDEDFYNWNVLNRFDHTELIAAMWPRSVYIEYGFGDPVTTPEWHEQAWKKVQAFRDPWGMQERIIDDRFQGGHTIHGVGSFFFLDRWLRPDRPARRDENCAQLSAESSKLPGTGKAPSSPLRCATQLLDSSPGSVVRGRFYVSESTPVLTGMSFKIARTGTPGDFLVRFGSTEGSDDLGVGRIHSPDVYPQVDLWYEAKLQQPVLLDPHKLYFFEITAMNGSSPNDCFTLFGPMPLGGEDEKSRFGLSFRTLTLKASKMKPAHKQLSPRIGGFKLWTEEPSYKGQSGD